MLSDVSLWSLFGISLLFGVMVVRGFTPHAVRKRDGTTFRLSAGITLVVTAYLARSFYWEITPALLRGFYPGVWALWFGWTGLAVNVVFTLVFLRGLYHLLVLLWLLIPLTDRGGWSVWTAAFYPDHNLFGGFINRLRLPRRGKRGGRND
jgi:hypothetical protein